MLGRLHAVERDLRGRCRNEWKHVALDERARRIATQRQERSRLLLDDFHGWRKAEAPKVLPKSPVRGAMESTLSNWTALCVSTEDGWLDLDNNEGNHAAAARVAYAVSVLLWRAIKVGGARSRRAARRERLAAAGRAFHQE